jgi:alpha-D-xyloside xylohydrolase
LVLARAQRCDVAQQQGVWSFTSAKARLEIGGEPLSIRMFHDGQQVLESITDEHFRGFTRLPVIGRGRTGAQWIAAFALGSGEPVYGLGEKFGPLNKRGQLIESQVEDALGVNTGLSYKNAPFCWSPGTGKAAWGVFVNTPGRVTHGVGYPDWSHRSYCAIVDDEALDLFLICGRDPAEVIEHYTHLTGRAPDVPLWGLGLWVSKVYYRTPGKPSRSPPSFAPRHSCDVRPWTPRGLGRADAFRFSLGPAALPRSAFGAGQDQGERPQDMRVGVPVRVDPLAAVSGPRQQALPAQDRRRRSVCVRLGYFS